MKIWNGGSKARNLACIYTVEVVPVLFRTSTKKRHRITLVGYFNLFILQHSAQTVALKFIKE